MILNFANHNPAGLLAYVESPLLEIPAENKPDAAAGCWVISKLKKLSLRFCKLLMSITVLILGIRSWVNPSVMMLSLKDTVLIQQKKNKKSTFQFSPGRRYHVRGHVFHFLHLPG